MASGKTKRQLQNMEPDQFEEMVAEIWRKQGYDTKVTKTSRDRGIDVEAIRQRPTGNEKILIQAKCYSDGNTVGSQDVRNYATLYQQEDDVDSVVIVTSSEFTTQGKELAKDLSVETINGQKAVDIIENNSISFNQYLETSSTKPIDKPDRLKQAEQTTKLGDQCPYCETSNSIWGGSTANTDRILICSSCDTKWVKREGSKWEALGKDKLTVKKWRRLPRLKEKSRNQPAEKKQSSTSSDNLSEDDTDAPTAVGRGSANEAASSSPFKDSYAKETANQNYFIEECPECCGTFWLGQNDFGRYLKCEGCDKTLATAKMKETNPNLSKAAGWKEISHIDEDSYEEHLYKNNNTRKLGKNCPICGELGSLYKGKRNSNDIIFCISCNCVWHKKTGIIASTKWEIKKKDMKKTASEWKSM